MKKVLIVSHNALSLHANNGKTLSSLFAAWGAAEIAQIYFQEEIPESDRFYNFFRIRDLDVVKNFITLGALSAGGTVFPQRRVVDHYSSLGSLKRAILFLLRRFNRFKLLARDILYSFGGWDSKELRAWIGEFSPESIFFLGGNSVFSFKIAMAIAESRNIPLDVYLTDDYVLNSKPVGFLGRYLHRKLLLVYRDVFLRARHAFVIGDTMASAFSGVFKREFLPIMNSVSFPRSVPNEVRFVENKEGGIQILYAGGLHLGRDRSIIRFGEFLNEVRARLKIEIVFSVCSGTHLSASLSDEFDRVGISFLGMLERDELIGRLHSSHFVLHVESFDEEYVSMTGFSVSTKIPEYLSSGACLIAYGPRELASIKIVEENGIGIVFPFEILGAESSDKLVDAIMNASLAQCFAKTGFEYGKMKFDLPLVRDKFINILN